MRLFLRKMRWLAFALSIGSVVGSAQAQVTLRGAIQQALKQNPDADVANASTQEAKAEASLARTQLLPQVNFTEDISRGDDPVYVFGTKLRQHRFTVADFDINTLNQPDSVGNFASRFSGSWMAFESLRTLKTIRSANLMEASAAASAKAVDQKIVFGVVQAYQAVLYAERQFEVAQHELETAEALLTSVDDRVKAGLAVESDRMSAQVNEASARQGLIVAQGELDLAWAQLRVAVGAPDLAQSKIQAIERKEFPESTLDQELQTAAKTRPDLAALGQAQSAQAIRRECGEMELRTPCERVRQLGRRPAVVR
jgi:outer membrane protein